jgi:Na+-transporting NADH:ubiquinone oxidoreductase subunit B
MSAAKPKKLFMMQPMMLHVVYGLIPCVLASIYYFGWRSLAVIVLSLVVGIVTEGLFTYRKGKPITSAVFVSSLIFALSLPPTIPFWMAALGMIFGTVFGKMVFGGFGFNVYNPAMVGRCFLYISFPVALTNQWLEPVGGKWGGFTAWMPSLDAMTRATPLTIFKDGGDYPLYRLLIGFQPGSYGETCALLVILGGLYIIWKKSAKWRLVVSSLAGACFMVLALRIAGVENVPPLLKALASGSLLFGVFFVVTEPISGAKTNPGQWIYGFLIGVLIILIRRYSSFPAAVMFSVLFMNTFVPVLDYAVKEWQSRGKKA